MRNGKKFWFKSHKAEGSLLPSGWAGYMQLKSEVKDLEWLKAILASKKKCMAPPGKNCLTFCEGVTTAESDVRVSTKHKAAFRDVDRIAAH